MSVDPSLGHRGPRRLLVVALASVGPLTLGWDAAASAQGEVGAPVRAGDIEILDADNPTTVLTDGDSNTVFTLRLPGAATCPGDSANDQWRVQSFIVPATDDPGALTYGPIWPDGDGRYAVYQADTRPYSQVLLGQNEVAGQPGRILATPPLTMGVFPFGTLPEPAYRIGMACTLFGETAKYWDTELVMGEAPEAEPGGLSWRVATAASAAMVGSSLLIEDSSSLPGWPVLLVAGLFVGAASVLVVRWRLASRTPPLVKESA